MNTDEIDSVVKYILWRHDCIQWRKMIQSLIATGVQPSDALMIAFNTIYKHEITDSAEPN